jgi:hypothetical protein
VLKFKFGRMILPLALLTKPVKLPVGKHAKGLGGCPHRNRARAQANMELAHTSKVRGGPHELSLGKQYARTRSQQSCVATVCHPQCFLR